MSSMLVNGLGRIVSGFTSSIRNMPQVNPKLPVLLMPLVAAVMPLPVLVLVEHLSLREHGIN
jgi:hypothetical protein